MIRVAEAESDVNAHTESIGNGIKKRIWHKFSPELASQLSAKEPDIMAATILQGLHMWMSVANPLTRKEGGNCCYRSLADLAIDYPYWTESGIEHALHRAEQRLNGKFTIRRDRKTLWFHMDPKFRKGLEKATLLMFRIEDALAHGVVKALLLSNLRWQFQQPRGFEVDENGNKFAELSATKLTAPDEITGLQIIPKSYKTICRALNELCVIDKILLKHPRKVSFYTFADTLNHPSENENHNRTKRDSDRTKRDSRGTKRDDLLCAYCNEIVIEDCKDNSYAALAQASPSQASESESLSKGARYLLKIANDTLDQIRNQQAMTSARNPSRVHSSLLPYDDFSNVDYDLPYDDIPVKVKGRVTMRSQEINQAIDIIKANWRCFKVKYTKQDLFHLRQLFADNPSFKVEHWESLEFSIASTQSAKRQSDGDWVNGKISSKVKTATARLRYLPQIIYEAFVQSAYEKDLHSSFLSYQGEIPEPYRYLDYSYLGKSVNSKLIENAFNAGGLN